MLSLKRFENQKLRKPSVSSSKRFRSQPFRSFLDNVTE